MINGRGHALTHEGISLHAEGQVSLQLSAKSVGLFEAFYSSIRPVQLLDFVTELQGAAKLPDGLTEFPFEFPSVAKRVSAACEVVHVGGGVGLGSLPPDSCLSSGHDRWGTGRRIIPGGKDSRLRSL